MASLDSMKRDVSRETPVPDDDIELLVRTGIKIMKDMGGMQLIDEAINTSNDPVQAIGQFLGQLVMRLGEDVAQELDLDPRALFAKGGFLEEMLNYIEDQLGLPEEFSDSVYNEVVELVKAATMPPSQAAPQMQGPGLQGRMGA